MMRSPGKRPAPAYRGIAGVFASLALLVAAPAFAHHPTGETSLGHATPASFAALDVGSTGFNLPGGEGTYYTLKLRGEYAPVSTFGIGMAVPIHMLKLHGEALRVGIGDLDLVAKLRVVDVDHPAWTLAVALGAELPTGDSERGLGSGHVELQPFLATMVGMGALVLHGTLGVNASLAGDHDHHDDDGHDHGDPPIFVNPHSDLELVYHAGLLWQATDWLFVNGVVAANTVLVEEHRGDTFVVLAPACRA